MAPRMPFKLTSQIASVIAVSVETKGIGGDPHATNLLDLDLQGGAVHGEDAAVSIDGHALDTNANCVVARDPTTVYSPLSRVGLHRQAPSRFDPELRHAGNLPWWFDLRTLQKEIGGLSIPINVNEGYPDRLSIPFVGLQTIR